MSFAAQLLWAGDSLVHQWQCTGRTACPMCCCTIMALSGSSGDALPLRGQWGVVKEDVLKNYYGIQVNMEGSQCCISMEGYIDNLFIKVNHAHPMKPCLSPYKYAPITYGTKTQLALDMDTSESRQCPQKLLPRNCWIPTLLSCLCSGQQATCCTQCLM